MKTSALEVLVCPSCRPSWRSTRPRNGREDSRRHAHVPLCGTTYPIRDGVPRFVPQARTPRASALSGTGSVPFRSIRIMRRRRPSDALRATTGWRDEEFRGRLLLDAGVGAGRFAERAAAKGARGVRRRSDERDRCRLSRTSASATTCIWSRPTSSRCRSGTQTFDLAYSIGVLHHTPDPQAAFGRVAATVKPGGKFAVYMYARYGSAHRASDAIRT